MRKQLLAEAFGTMMLVIIGCGAVIVNDITEGAVTHIGVCLAFVSIVVVMMLSIGHISSCHINPSITIALWLEKRFEGKKVIPYIIAQIVGATIGSFILKILFPTHRTLGATLPQVSFQSTFTIELIISASLFAVVLAITRYTHKLPIIAMTVGVTVFVLAFFSGPYTGASMNPARSIGPAIASGNFTALWIYLTAPTLGMILPGLIIAKNGVSTSQG
jgi:MIP family channel proteins